MDTQLFYDPLLVVDGLAYWSENYCLFIAQLVKIFIIRYDNLLPAGVVIQMSQVMPVIPAIPMMPVISVIPVMPVMPVSPGY